jgi:dephospho-CoA kinase
VQKLDFLVSKQMPDAEKRSRADYVIDTSVSIADSQKQVDHILSELIRSAGP